MLPFGVSDRRCSDTAGFKLPILVIPCILDQFHNAMATEREGVGQVLMPEKVTLNRLRKSMNTLNAHDQAYRENISRVYDSKNDCHEFEQAYQGMLSRVGLA